MHYQWLVMGLAATQAAARLPISWKGYETSSMPGTGTGIGTGTAISSGTGVSTGTGSAPTSTSISTATGSAPAGTSSSTSTGTAPTGTATNAPKGPHWITAHPDGQCRRGMNTTASMTFEITDGFPLATTVKAPDFPGAEAKTGSGYDVWWSIPDPGQGCRSIIMLPYNQDRGTPGYAPGKEIINAGRAGCYAGSVPAGADVMFTFCCGRDHCNATSLGSASLLASPVQREVDVREYIGEEQTVQHNWKDAPAPLLHAGSIAGRAVSSLKERWYLPPPPKDTGCTFAPGQPYSQAGPQRIITAAQRCSEAPCNVAINTQMSFSTTATSSSSQTITNSVGVSVGLSAGVNFIEKAELTTTLSYDFSIALEKSTGTSIMTGNSTSVTNTLATKLGALGAVSFTPIYTCWTGPMDCGKGVSDPLHFCQPDRSDVGVYKGEYDFVVFG